MARGPGKYDDLATHVREATDADIVVVIVFGGTKGSGFSLQADAMVDVTPLVAVLRSVANTIERDGLAADSRLH
jgi:FAD/FMN-containing dehydrogenase